MTGTPKTGTLKTVVLDTPDHLALANFYVDLLGASQVYADDEWATVVTSDGWRLGFQAAPDHVAPQWPDPTAPAQMHLDFQVADREAAAVRAEALGARRLGGGETWTVMADPAGHPFCLSTNADTEGITVFAVNIDSDQSKALAAFYGEVLGMAVKWDSDEGMWIGSEAPGLNNILFQAVTDYQAPQWPDPARPQQLHLDIKVQDADAAEASVIALGASRLPGEGENWRVYADPAGHPFCLLTNE